MPQLMIMIAISKPFIFLPHLLVSGISAVHGRAGAHDGACGGTRQQKKRRAGI